MTAGGLSICPPHIPASRTSNRASYARIELILFEPIVVHEAVKELRGVFEDDIVVGGGPVRPLRQGMLP